MDYQVKREYERHAARLAAITESLVVENRELRDRLKEARATINREREEAHDKAQFLDAAMKGLQTQLIVATASRTNWANAAARLVEERDEAKDDRANAERRIAFFFIDFWSFSSIWSFLSISST